ncbi:MAG TPA: fatty acid desaturase [Ardenticatenaceae bacterium]|nr:fatty acid desaturase [Ardenticatenaceae bacterium]
MSHPSAERTHAPTGADDVTTGVAADDILDVPTSALSDVAIIDPADPNAPHHDDHQAEHISTLVKVVNLLAVILPFIGLIAGVVLHAYLGYGWVHVCLLLAMYALTVLGITVGFHRLFTHRAFETNRVVKATLAILGSMAVQGPLIQWVAMHRRHHQHSDTHDDPHSPHAYGSGLVGVIKGMWHAHMGWLFRPDPAGLARYAADLYKDRLLRTLSTLFPLWVTIGLLVPALIGGLITMSWGGALLGFLWGGLARVFLVHHVTWSINSVCHLWGSRPFRSHDESRNNVIFGVLAFGEGWHNNHHAFPTSARHGLFWWQFDLSYLIIRGMEAVGLATNVKVPAAHLLASKQQQ